MTYWPARGDKPRAERVEIAVDLRDDWPQALRENGFDDSRPAAFLAEGLLIYLPATAQGDLFRGIDAFAAPGSFVGIEEGEPMPDEVFQAMRAAEKAEGGDMSFFALIYNQQFAPAADWFGNHGWDAAATPLAGYLDTVRSTRAGRRVRSWLDGQIKHTGQRHKAVAPPSVGTHPSFRQLACGAPRSGGVGSRDRMADGSGCRQNMNGRRNLVIRRRYSG